MRKRVIIVPDDYSQEELLKLFYAPTGFKLIKFEEKPTVGVFTPIAELKRDKK